MVTDSGRIGDCGSVGHTLGPGNTDATEVPLNACRQHRRFEGQLLGLTEGGAQARSSDRLRAVTAQIESTMYTIVNPAWGKQLFLSGE